jgi:kynurenine formamidase
VVHHESRDRRPLSHGHGAPVSTERANNWGRWGDDDEVGAVNLLSPEKVLAAIAVPRQGRIIPLSSEVGKNGALTGGRNPTWHVSIQVQVPADPGRGRAEDMLTMHTHAHSHMDGLAHIWYDGRLYNGFPASSVGRGGATRLSIGAVGGVVTRGLCLDLTDGGRRAWDVGELIEVADLEAALAAIDATIEPGDAVLLHSAWLALFQAGDARFHQGEPGLSPAAVDWLAAQDPVLVGMDNSAIEPLPPRPGTNPLYVHETLLRDHGIYMLELLDLAELAASGAGTFLFVVAPLRIDRGLGSPVNPIAIV